MEPLVFFAAFVLAAALHAAGQPGGFLSIDCGLDASFSGYKDPVTGLVFVDDGKYVDAGENHRVSAADAEGTERFYVTLRSFPTGGRNCYALPTETGSKYLVRLIFFYGNYDGKNISSTLQFDLHLGVDYWATVYGNDRPVVYEAVFMARASWSPVCLVNTDQGTPFVSTVELRKLDGMLYPEVMANESISMYDRGSMGANVFIRYPEDPYDRYWWAVGANPLWANLSTTQRVQPDPTVAVPLPVIQTAVTAAGNGTMLNITWHDTTHRVFKVFVHVADFQNSRLRQFNATFNDVQASEYSPPYLTAYSLSNPGWSKAADGLYNISLVATSASVLPPMMNAYEIYNLITHDNPTTFAKDFDAIMAIKLEYGVKKHWTGDPCFPYDLAWEGVKCSKTNGSINTPRIISLDLSNSKLHGVISNNFTLLTALTYLNLSGNQLNGPIPDSLCKNNAGSLVFSLGSEEDVCDKTIKPTPSRNIAKSGKKVVILVISIVVPVVFVVVAALVVACVIWRVKTKPNTVSANYPPREAELENAVASEKNHGDPLQKTENRQFTYKELEKFTNKFERFIGKGGFGSVYYGRIEDGTEVAVKMRSESSSHGLDEFFAEVQCLTKVHHRNLVSLVGHCWEKDHLALVYSYMGQGNLCDRLRGNKGAGETLNWGTRLRVVLEAAQGLDYLHKGCSPPIIHRDVKSSNILLGQNLQAKIADFGLSKTYLNDMMTHMSLTAAGTAGYIDPEYYQTGRLAESSDVYSFGIVLLEIATGEAPILAGEGHIVQRAKRKITTGNISSFADARFGGAYDVSSMWKVVDTAMMCTVDDGSQRPTMAAVVVQLRESLALEEASENSGFRDGTPSDTTFSMSNFGPSAR